MLESERIQSRNSEIREQVAGLTGKSNLSEEETRSLDSLTAEYRQNESKYRAALIQEDAERREAGQELESRQASEWADLVSGYEIRQAAMNLDTGDALSGKTAEVVQEMRGAGGYRGVPVPLAALETRADVTMASDAVEPIQAKRFIDRIFPGSVAGKMGARLIDIDNGGAEYPVATDNVTAGWAGGEAENVGGPDKFKAEHRHLKPEHNLGVQVRVSRRAMKYSAGIEDAIRRDIQGAIEQKLDEAVFYGKGSSGEPAGIIANASDYGIDTGSLASKYSAFRAGIRAMMENCAITGPGDVSALMAPALFDDMDDEAWDSGSGISEFDRLQNRLKRVIASCVANEDTALLTAKVGGVEPIFLATWGGVDLIRDPYTDGHSGALRMTGIVTADVTVSRPGQLFVLNGGSE